jgi:hypothetical protein
MNHQTIESVEAEEMAEVAKYKQCGSGQGLTNTNVKLDLDCRLPIGVLETLERDLAAKGMCIDHLVEKLLLAEVGLSVDRLGIYQGSSDNMKYSEYLLGAEGRAERLKDKPDLIWHIN